MLNKPRGLVTTRDDPQERATVYDCLEGLDLPLVSPVGRLDKASEGLLLLTNDTRWAQRVLDPASNVEKVYYVQIDRLPNEAMLERLEAGMVLDGEPLVARSASLLRAGARNAWLEVVLSEGRNRQIRRLLDAVGADVLRLVRIEVGGLRLGDLPRGQSGTSRPPRRRGWMFRSGPEQARSGFRGGSKPQIADLSPDFGDRALQLEADHRGGDTLLDQGNQRLDGLIGPVGSSRVHEHLQICAKLPQEVG